MRASAETLQLVTDYYKAMDEGRLADCEQYLTPDATIQIAHRPPMVGWDTIFTIMQAGMSAPHVLGLTHDVKNAWEEEDGTAIFEVHATYSLEGDKTVVVPGIVIATIVDGRIASQRIGADLSPIYGVI